MDVQGKCDVVLHRDQFVATKFFTCIPIGYYPEDGNIKGHQAVLNIDFEGSTAGVLKDASTKVALSDKQFRIFYVVESELRGS